MCIAAYIPPQKQVGDEILRRCFQSNDDGAGFIIPSPLGVQVYKGFFTVQQFLIGIEPFMRNNAFGIVFHCRIATHGTIDKKNCHPHRVKVHNAAFVHNGIISGLEASKVKSDSIIFGETVLAELPKDWYRNLTLKRLIEEHIGNNNKIVYVSESSDVVILNEKEGEWSDGVWYSNASYKWAYSLSSTREFDWRGSKGDVQFADENFGYCPLCYIELDESDVYIGEQLRIEPLCLECMPKSLENEACALLDAFYQEQESLSLETRVNRKGSRR